MRTLRRGLAALVLLLLAAPALRAADASPYGLNVHTPFGPLLQQQFDKVQQANVGWGRIDFIWAWVQPQRGTYDWSAYDAIVQAAQQRNISILAIVAYTPQWATDGPEIAGVPRDPEDWRQFVSKAVQRYKGKIAAWEIWNEPNLTKFFAGTRQQYWDEILIPAADIVHATDPAAKVAGPALANLQSGDWSHWLLEPLQHAGDKLDIVTHHVYDSDGFADVTARLEGSTRFGSKPQYWNVVAPSVREVLKEANARSKPFWLTETGWQSELGGEANQAFHYGGLLEDWLSGDPDRSWVQKIFFYEIQDAEPDLSWGVLRKNGTPKAAWGTLADFIAQHAGGPPPPPPPPPPPGDPQKLSLLDGRFTLQATWRTSDGTKGNGTAVPYSRESGRFWFFAPGNTELLAKVLDGSAINGHAWLYWGALSDVEYWLTLTDTRTGKKNQYHNPPGTFCGGADVDAFAMDATAAPQGALTGQSVLVPLAGFDVAPAAVARPVCKPGPQTLCLGAGARFQVQARWKTKDGGSGNASAVAADSESGSFWFFSATNLELSVKVLDGRPLNGKFWVYFGALSDVEYWVTVTDLQTNAQRTYHNAAGTLCGQADSSAF